MNLCWSWLDTIQQAVLTQREKRSFRQRRWTAAFHDCADRRLNPGRLDKRLLLVALVLLINVPVGLLALAGCYFLLREPDYLVAQRAEFRKQPSHFDFDRFVSAGHRHCLLGSNAEQGPGVGLAGRSVLAHPDSRHLLYRGFGGASLLGDASPQPR